MQFDATCNFFYCVGFYFVGFVFVSQQASTPSSALASGTTGYWHVNFEIPDKYTFCGAVQDSIDTGTVCGRARRGIVQVLRTLIIQHTKYPSREEYNVICRKLIEKYPNLHDDSPNGFVSTTFTKLRI